MKVHVQKAKKREEAVPEERLGASVDASYGVSVALLDRGAAYATGFRTAAIATGDRGRAVTTAEYGVAVIVGAAGKASNSGNRGVAVATSKRGQAVATGRYGAAIASGIAGEVIGALGCALVAIERANGEEILSVAAAIVDGVNIKEDTWYACCGGKLVEVER